MRKKSYFRCIACRKQWIKRGFVDAQVCQSCDKKILPYKLTCVPQDEIKLLRELKKLAEAVANVALSPDSGCA